ncbi:MAG: CRTAC1 family protein [Deltaproteobacteria bacterium]|nr:CRTAC1 family protein [Deltaproteobacteria bacterium]
MTSQRKGAVLALALLCLGACRPTPRAATAPVASAAGAHDPRAAALAVDASTTDGLAVVVERLQAAITRLETTKDVTCWTTFRQLDSYISSKEYSAFATHARVLASKALARAAWQKASTMAKGPALTAADIAAAAPIPASGWDDDQRGKLAAFAKDHGLKAFADYRTTSEHYRVLLSVVFDELQAEGRSPLLPPADDAAYDALADVTTRLGLALLQRAGTLAVQERTPLIEATAVQRAHAELAERWGLRNPPRTDPLRTDADIVAALGPLTEAMIVGKIKALNAYNRNSQDLVADLNRLAQVPVTEEAVGVWLTDLQSFAHFLAAGFDPMQADNFLNDGQFEETALRRRAVVDYAHAESASLQLFPHVLMPNGDLKLRFEPAPGFPGDVPRQGLDATILDHEQNGVRDTAIHWLALASVWREKAFAMDPFAAEYVSELLSMMATWYLRRGEALARETGAATIDADLARKVRDRRYVMVMPQVREAAAAWSKARWDHKAAVLADHATRTVDGAMFADATAQSRLPVALPVAGSSTSFDIHKVMGAGVAVGDLDGDGFADLFIAGEGLGRLYLNGGKAAPGTFRDATHAWAVPQPIDDARHPLFVDADGDGDLDLLVVRSEHPTLLLDNQGGRFVDIAERAGLSTWRGAHVATVFDADGDGDLDVYIGYYGSDAANRTRTATRNLPALDGKNGTPHQLFLRGPDGRYRDGAPAAGVANTAWTLAAGAWDYDGDGDQDLLLANDFGADLLYRNRGNGTFDDVSERTRTDDRGSGMNVSFTDANGDGRLDAYVSNIDMFSKNIKVVYPKDASTIDSLDAALASVFQYLSGNKLYLNPGDPEGEAPFQHSEIARFEPGDRGWGWASVFFDADLDGDEDLYLANGWIAGSFAADQKNQWFVAQGGYYYLAPDGPEAFAGNSRSVVAFDADGDGDLDLLANQFRQPPRLLRNIQASGHHWLRVRVRQSGPNPRGVGAVITVRTPSGMEQLRTLGAGCLYLGQDDGHAHFGLGGANQVRVQVRWPDGKVQDAGIQAADRVVEVVRR